MDQVLVDVTDGIGRITLNRPDAANAFDLPTAHALGSAVERMEVGDVRVVLVTGSGARFSAGGDVISFLTSGDPERYLFELATVLESHVRRLANLPKPVVAAVHGAVAGAGLAFALTADLVVAAPTTKFVMAYANLGLTPDCGVSYLLPRVVGLRRALDFTLNRRVLNAEEALNWGLVSTIDEDPLALATALGAQLAGAPAAALGQARRLLRTSYDVPRDEHAADEASTIATSIGTPEAQRLVARFISK